MLENTTQIKHLHFDLYDFFQGILGGKSIPSLPYMSEKLVSMCMAAIYWGKNQVTRLASFPANATENMRNYDCVVCVPYTKEALFF